MAGKRKLGATGAASELVHPGMSSAIRLTPRNESGRLPIVPARWPPTRGSRALEGPVEQAGVGGQLANGSPWLLQ
eukprot:4609993-Alexandrium_andersonii.AAC.1